MVISSDNPGEKGLQFYFENRAKINNLYNIAQTARDWLNSIFCKSSFVWEHRIAEPVHTNRTEDKHRYAIYRLSDIVELVVVVNYEALWNSNPGESYLRFYFEPLEPWIEPTVNTETKTHSLQALQQNKELEIIYENFVGKKYTGIIQPLCIKLFKRRWYVLGRLPEGNMRIFSLDRLKDLFVTDNKFVYPANFLANDYFANFYGILVTDGKPEKIIIRTYNELPGYLRSLPLHPTQQELATKDGHTDFSLCLVPTFDFIQELLLHRDQIEVLAPQSLRDEIAQIILRMSQRYNHN